jgi:hypothetical protein
MNRCGCACAGNDAVHRIGSACEGVGGAGEDAGTITGSLVHLLDRTKTRAGSRLLREWVVHPLIDSSSICERQDAVHSLMDNQDVLNTIREVRHSFIYKIFPCTYSSGAESLLKEALSGTT